MQGHVCNQKKWKISLLNCATAIDVNKNIYWVGNSIFDFFYPADGGPTCISRLMRFEIQLTLKSLSYFSLPFVHKGVHLDPFIFEYFSVGISVRNLHHMLVHLKQPSAKRTIKKTFCYKMAAKTNYRFTQKVTWQKFEKQLSWKNFSIKFGSKLENINTFIFLK